MKIDNHSMVSIEYKLFDKKNNDLLDSNIGKEPLTFIVGENQIVKGLESALIGKEVNFTGDITVLPQDGYGVYDNEAIEKLPKENFAGIELKKGMTLYGQGDNNQTIQVTVKEFDDNSVTIDYNHPLAGKELLFWVSVLNIKHMTKEEVEAIKKEESCETNGGGCGSGCGCS